MSDKKTKKSIFLRLIREAGSIKWGIVFSLTLSLLAMTCSLIAPQILSSIIDRLNEFWRAKALNEDAVLQNLVPTLIVLGVVYVLQAVFTYSKSFCMSNFVSRFFTAGIRIKMSQKASRLPISYIDRTKPGEVLSRMTEDVSVLGNSVHQIFEVVGMGAVQLIAVTVLVFMQNTILALIVIGLTPISMLVAGVIASKCHKHYKIMHEQQGLLFSQVDETYGNLSAIRAYRQEQDRLDSLIKINKRSADSALKGGYSEALIAPVVAFINSLTYITICLVGGYLAVKGSIGVGMLVSMIFYTKLFAQPLENIGQVVGNAQNVRASASRVFEIMDEAEMSKESEDIVISSDCVRFEDVRFRYNEDEPLIEGMNLSVDSGQKVAIVGATGGGKTTIVNLLMRFYDLNGGAIRLGGVDISKTSRRSIRDVFGMVLQDTWLFKGTIHDNIAYGMPNATREQVEDASRHAFCDHFIRALPKGYDTEIDENATNISGGQKQLLTIARAILADRRILILDEATSNVDTRTEVFIQKAMDELMGGKTCFIIAHRLSTIVNADVILVIDKGTIIEKGTHKELLEKEGYYYDLFNSQYNIA